MKPNFTHDCDKCQFLGSTVIDGKTFDLYYCAYEPTIIARWSNDGADYSSGISFGEHTLVRFINGETVGNKALMVAYVTAMANGLNVKSTVNADIPLVEKIVKYQK